MVFYETYVFHAGHLAGTTSSYITEVDARKKFNKAKHNLAKSKKGGEISYYKITCRTDLTKNEWVRLLLSDVPGLCELENDELLCPRDLITSRVRLGIYISTTEEK